MALPPTAFTVFEVPNIILFPVESNVALPPILALLMNALNVSLEPVINCPLLVKFRVPPKAEKELLSPIVMVPRSVTKYRLPPSLTLKVLNVSPLPVVMLPLVPDWLALVSKIAPLLAFNELSLPMVILPLSAYINMYPSHVVKLSPLPVVTEPSVLVNVIVRSACTVLLTPKL